MPLYQPPTDPKPTTSARDDSLDLGLSNIVWGLDPDVIVVVGAITEAWSKVNL